MPFVVNNHFFASAKGVASSEVALKGEARF